jgi:hypothetical protein
MKRLATLITAVVVGPVALTVATTAHAAPDDARRPAAYTVTAKVDTQDVTLGEGEVVKISGKVRPRAAGKRVVLEQRRRGTRTWSIGGRQQVKGNGTFVFTAEPTVVGTQQYRVRKPASGGVKVGVSPVVEVQVYAWQKLAQRPRGVNENVAVSSTALIGTQAYPYSIQPFTRGAPSYVEYPLRGLCTLLRTTYALAGSPVAGSSGRVTLALDGVVKVDQALTLGQVVESTTDLTGASVLRYELFSDPNPTSNKPAVATPEVRCTK